MKNKYQEELHKIVMSEELKQKIKEECIVSKPHKQKSHIKFTIGTVSLACTCILAFALMQPSNKKEMPQVANHIESKDNASNSSQGSDGKTGTAEDISKDKTTKSKSLTGMLDVTSFYPKTYKYAYGGFGAPDKRDEKQILSLDTYTQKKAYTDVIGKLPIYEELHPKNDVRYLNPLSESERNKIVADYSKKLNMKGISISHGSVLVDYDMEKIQEGSYIISGIEVKENGDVEIRINTKGNHKENTKEELEAVSKKLYKKYKSIMPIQHPVWNTTSKDQPYINKTIQATQIYEKGSDKEELINQATSSVTFESKNNEDIKTYEILLTAKENLKTIKEVDIMDKKEAQRVLLAGGYISDFPIEKESIQEEHIQHIDLLYRDANADNTDTYAPYVIPFYRFYIQEDKNNDIRIADVPALYPDDLKALDKNTWYFK